MTKAELVNQIAMETGYDKATILGIVECAMECVKKNVAAGENVYLRGFGSFITKVRAEKVARNIKKNTFDVKKYLQNCYHGRKFL